MRHLQKIAATVTVVLLASGQSSLAQSEYPSRTVRMIVPLPAGGATDASSRVVAEGLKQQLGQSVAVENRPGGNGVTGTMAGSQAEPDGYTITMALAQTFTTLPNMSKSLPYDPIKNFASIGMIGTSLNVLLVPKSLEVNNVAELLALARKKPGELNFASAGAASSSYVAGELLKARTGVKIVHVPYLGAIGYTTDLMENRVQIAFQVFSGAVQSIETGKIKALAVTSTKRWPTMPDVPTMAESGVPNFEIVPWLGLSAPAGTPAPVINRLNVALRNLLKDPKIVKALATLGTLPTPGSPADMNTFVANDLKIWKELVAVTGARLN